MSNILTEGVIIKDKKTLERFRKIINESTDIKKISENSINWYKQQKKAQEFLDCLNERKKENVDMRLRKKKTKEHENCYD